MLPDTRVLMLTASIDEDAALQAVAAGATGYLQKYSTGQKLVATLRDVAEGEFRVPAGAMRRMAASSPARPSQAETEQAASLTAREKEILGLFCQGMSYAEIAGVVGYRPLSIRNTIYGIQIKVKSKPEMVVRGLAQRPARHLTLPASGEGSALLNRGDRMGSGLPARDTSGQITMGFQPTPSAVLPPVSFQR